MSLMTIVLSTDHLVTDQQTLYIQSNLLQCPPLLSNTLY
jgi:hypothetical protein